MEAPILAKPPSAAVHAGAEDPSVFSVLREAMRADMTIYCKIERAQPHESEAMSKMAHRPLFMPMKKNRKGSGVGSRKEGQLVSYS
jgi:hypothetical protein